MRHAAENQRLPFPILLGDIGGTNARFSILLHEGAEPISFPNVATADFPTIDEAIRVDVLEKTPVKPKSTILAVAGPIEGDEIDLTNCDWVVRPQSLIADLGFTDVLVLNDFEAQALAAACLTEDYRQEIGKPAEPMIASRVVLGPGTGLGVAGLVHARETWFPVPGEGGHVDVGPRSKRDFEIFPYLEPIEGRISAEQLLCGRGLVNIYRAICAADGVEATLALPSDVTAGWQSGRDLQAAETISLFATYLGRLAGDLALIFMAKGGVFLAGGISQRIIPALKAPEFRQAFEDKAPHSDLLRQIPTFVVTHPLAALAGLGSYARTPSAYGISTHGRHWTR
ncbi:glucokinase [Rhizobium halophilum]|uniref:glucokinase n=1 Tax=Rhizobium halophilum TaxID=2846852 RepID=UPI001EFE461B|nr:glucokinase [Rhizobium halophilum]MCF6369209.1 glucokinase [Rhizobium halophilum]